jgi:hypothetical protein
MEQTEKDSQHEHQVAVEGKEMHLKVQTPRGLWDDRLPPKAKKRPVYEPNATVQQVLDDVRSVFEFVENDNVYTLLHNKIPLNSRSTLKEAGIHDGALLVLTVQGGNA